MFSDSGVARDRELEEARHQPDRAVHEAHVPVGLRAGGDRRRVVGPVDPDRVDLEDRRQQGRDAEHDEEEAAGLRDVHREERVADDVVVGAAGARVLGVLLHDQQDQVGRDQRQEDGGQQQHVDRVEPRDERLAGELARRTGRSSGTSRRPGWPGRCWRRSAGRCRTAGRRAASSRRSPRRWPAGPAARRSPS